jgi:hypothetical protein
MEKKEGGKGAPPEFLSTHPGYETRVQQLRSFLPEALTYYQPREQHIEALPLPESLDTATARAERELLKRVAAINRFIEEQNGERAVVEALAYELRMNPQIVVHERQQYQIGYGQYAALRGLAHLSGQSIERIADDYRRGRSWSEMAVSRGNRITDLTRWFSDLIQTTGSVGRQLKSQPLRPNTRVRP